MPDLLFLCRRIPYPPNRGDRVRSWHMLRHLAQRHRVHLGCFVDDPAERRWGAELRQLCVETHFSDLQPKSRPSNLRHGDLSQWVEETLAARRPTHALAASRPMADYVPDGATAVRRRVVDMQHVESDRWRQHAVHKPWPISLIRRRAAGRLLDLERRTARRFDATLFASGPDAALFRRLAPESADRVSHLDSGVDCDYFTPSRDFPNPFPNDRKAAVFLGTMDCAANVAAVQWFVRDVLPALWARRLELGFWMVGAEPTAAVRRLAEPPRVMVTGAVDDVRPYLAHAAVVVVPLRHPRGIQTMVLEAMSMARPVIATPEALDGLAVEPGRDVAQASDAKGFALALAAALSGRGGEAMGARARSRVAAAHGWTADMARLDAALDG